MKTEEADFLCKAQIVGVVQQNGLSFVSCTGCNRKLAKFLWCNRCVSPNAPGSSEWHSNKAPVVDLKSGKPTAFASFAGDAAKIALGNDGANQPGSVDCRQRQNPQTPTNVPSKSARTLHASNKEVYHENFPYGSFHSSVNFASDTFPFSSQQSEDAPVDDKLPAPYSQPSEDEPLFGNNDDSDYSETEDLIRHDQAELSLERCSQVHYPPQPEVEFGFPQVCYCGAHPVLATSNTRNDQGMCYRSCLIT
ncbi:hypothetical protein Bca52824_060122 [Brassica carinata]|uniref:Uncharacterized protein n=1 Tax=Brassica carinata TaxID=52824 RepID=A0A8X7QWW1_BRACI|nr:hypothetical protein Bca52824_060122 [Brassica carinata]